MVDIGLQSHLSVGAIVTPGTLEALAVVVPEVAVIELDVTGAAIADYERVFQACLDVSNCVGVTIWSVSYSQNCRPGSNPLLFHGSCKPKAAYTALVKYAGSKSGFIQRISSHLGWMVTTSLLSNWHGKVRKGEGDAHFHWW